MDEEDPLLRTVASRLANEARARPSEHPTGAAIHCYLAGNLDTDSQAELQEHLSGCARCTQEFLDLQELLVTPVTDDDLREAVEVWPRLRSRLVDEGVLPSSAADRRAEARVTGRGARWRLSWALAASSALLLGTTAYFALQVQLARRPQANVLVIDLVPTTEAPIVRGVDGIEEIVVPDAADRVLLVLNAPADEPSAGYRLEIRDGATDGGALRWASELEGRTRTGNFNLDLPRDFLPDGTYSLRIIDVGGRRQVIVANYHLRIRHER